MAKPANGRDLLAIAAERVLEMAEIKTYGAADEFNLANLLEDNLTQDVLDQVHEDNITSLAGAANRDNLTRDELLEAIEANRALIDSRKSLREDFSNGISFIAECRVAEKAGQWTIPPTPFDHALKRFSNQMIFDASSMLKFGLHQLELSMIALDDGGAEMEDIQRLHEAFVNELRRVERALYDCCPGTRTAVAAIQLADMEPLHVAILDNLKHRLGSFSSQLACVREAAQRSFHATHDQTMLGHYLEAMDQLNQALDNASESIYLVQQHAKQVQTDAALRGEAGSYIARAFESKAERQLREQKTDREIDLLQDAGQLALARQPGNLPAQSSAKTAKKKNASAKSAAVKKNALPSGKPALEDTDNPGRRGATPLPGGSAGSAVSIRSQIAKIADVYREHIAEHIAQADQTVRMIRKFSQNSAEKVASDLDWANGDLCTALNKARQIDGLYRQLAQASTSGLQQAELAAHGEIRSCMTKLDRKLAIVKDLDALPIALARKAFSDAPSLRLFTWLHERGQFARSNDAGRKFVLADVSHWGYLRECPDEVQERELRFVMRRGDPPGQAGPQAYPHFHYGPDGALASIFLKKTEPAQRFRSHHNGRLAYHGLVDAPRTGKIGEAGKAFVEHINAHLLPAHAVPLKVDRQSR